MFSIFISSKMVGIVILYPADIGHIRPDPNISEMAGYNRIPDTAENLVHPVAD